MNPLNKAIEIVNRIMFVSPLIHLDEVKEVAKIVVEEIRFNCLDDALKFWNQVNEEIEKL
jgi:hypothetical protein